MSIHEQAQQLSALAEQVPVGMSMEIANQLEGLRAQVNAIVGETATANEIMGQIGVSITEAQQLSAGLSNLQQVIGDKAAYHQQG